MATQNLLHFLCRDSTTSFNDFLFFFFFSERAEENPGDEVETITLHFTTLLILLAR